jgi:hypothetical protein
MLVRIKKLNYTNLVKNRIIELVLYLHSLFDITTMINCLFYWTKKALSNKIVFEFPNSFILFVQTCIPLSLYRIMTVNEIFKV